MFGERPKVIFEPAQIGQILLPRSIGPGGSRVLVRLGEQCLYVAIKVLAKTSVRVLSKKDAPAVFVPIGEKSIGLKYNDLPDVIEISKLEFSSRIEIVTIPFDIPEGFMCG
jgi:hypothetical protein